MKHFYTLFILIGAHTFLFGQSESILKDQLEGQRVEILIELPASSEGIDVYADRGFKMNFDDYSRRIKKYGTSLFPGDIVMITKIKKKGKHIEFQLAGGGYGTWGDESSSVSAAHVPKSSRQKEIEKMLRDDKDKELPNRRALQKELDQLEYDRSIAQKENQQEAAYQSEIKKARIQEQRLQGGSRINIRYDYKIGRDELTLQSIVKSLSEYINFKPNSERTSGYSSGSPQLAKGITMEEAAQLFGFPKNLKTDQACELERTLCSFETNGQIIEAVFVEGVLVKYTIESN